MIDENAKKLIKNFWDLMEEDSESAIFCRESKILYKQHAIYEPNTLMKKLHEIDFDNNNIYDLVDFIGEVVDLTGQVVKAVYDKDKNEENNIIVNIEEFFVYTGFLQDLRSLDNSLKKTLLVENVKLSARMIEILSQGKEISFEKKCQNVCFVIQDIFENWHKKLLVGMLEITNYYNKNFENLPKTYGAVIIRCNNERIFPYIDCQDIMV